MIGEKVISKYLAESTLEHILTICDEKCDDNADAYFRAMWAECLLRRVETFTKHRLKDFQGLQMASETEDDFDRYKEYRVI